MNDAEWEQVMHFMFMVHPGPGRPSGGARRCLDACCHAACMPKPWRELPPVHGKPDSVSRLFRRWAHAGLWSSMLKFVARERSGMEAVQYFICRAFRRAWRIQGWPGIILARRLGLHSALRAPAFQLPDPDLSERVHRELIFPLMPHLFTMRRSVAFAPLDVMSCANPRLGAHHPRHGLAMIRGCDTGRVC